MDRAKLLKKYPTLEVRNKTNSSQSLLYLRDSVTVIAGATRRVSSDGLLQIPDTSLFELVKPTLFDLHKAGIIVIQNGTSETVTKGEPDVSLADSAVAAEAALPLNEQTAPHDVVLSPEAATTAEVPVSPASPTADSIAPVNLTGKDNSRKRGS